MPPPQDKPKLGVVSPPGLPPHRSEAIAGLTARARVLNAEGIENGAKIDTLQIRNAAIRRELDEINRKVIEHAWDGNPSC